MRIGRDVIQPAYVATLATLNGTVNQLGPSGAVRWLVDDAPVGGRCADCSWRIVHHVAHRQESAVTAAAAVDSDGG